MRARDLGKLTGRLGVGRLIAGVVCILALGGALPFPAEAIWDELTDARVQEALQYGRDRADQPLERLLEPWTVRFPDGRAALVVKSDFISLAQMGWSAQRNGQPLPAKELDMETFVLRALKETLRVDGVVSSSSIGLLEGVQLHDGRTVRDAISVQVKFERAGSDEAWRFEAYFPSSGLTRASKVRLLVLGFGGKEVAIPIDLSKIR